MSHIKMKTKAGSYPDKCIFEPVFYTLGPPFLTSISLLATRTHLLLAHISHIGLRGRSCSTVLKNDKIQTKKPYHFSPTPTEHDPPMTLTQFCAVLKTVLHCKAYETQP